MGGRLARRQDLVEELHGVRVADPYRWLEQPDDPAVREWVSRSTAEANAHTGALSQHAWLYEQLQRLWRYDDETVRKPVLVGERQLWSTRRADQDKWVVHVADGPDDPGRVLIDPNAWAQTEQLDGLYPSRDGRYVAYGVSTAGDEDPKVRVLDVQTGEHLPDTLRGWKQRDVTWLPDDSGFFYSAKPLASEVEQEGDEFYYHRACHHVLGTAGGSDPVVFDDTEVKETWHSVQASPCGRWLVWSRSRFNASALWLQAIAPDAPRVAMATELDHEYSADVLDDRILVTTDWGAPRYRVMVAQLDRPGREHWTELIGEHPSDTLEYIACVAGRIYAVYQHDVVTRLVVYDLEGRVLAEPELPTLGTAGVSGQWARADVWVSFTSFAHPAATYRLDPDSHALELVKPSAAPLDPALLERIVVEQEWVTSPDGTRVPMFVVHDRDATGPSPVLLTGYGGFNISMTPSFRSMFAMWVQAGGTAAMAALRGGGEFGQEWHNAGMRQGKQRVFDDFLACADHLVSAGWTTPEQLAIAGGSNGGLLVSAAVTQRPELFEAVLCTVPLTDMLRFHHFGIANIWTEEYGSPDDPEMFPYIHAYSPYHRLVSGTRYPAMLIVGSANDARTDPVHARKFAAAARWADADHGGVRPILLEILEDSGHGGGVTIDVQADQTARHYGFLMHEVGLQAPSGGD